MTKEDQDALKQKAKDEYKKLGESRFIKIKEGFYNDAEFEFDFIITNEQADPIAIATNIKELMVDMAANPNILNDPRLKLLFGKFAENLGISPAEMELADQQAQLQANQQQNVQQQIQQRQTSPIGGATALPAGGQGQTNAPVTQ